MQIIDKFRSLLQHRAAWWVAAGVGLLLTLWWPGDTKWVNDEPKSLHIAYVANQNGHLATKGIDHPGSTGIMYPPVPSWFYQILLLISDSDLVAVAFLQNLFFTGAMLVFLWLLARELAWSPWPALLVLVSPYLYLLNRQIWDNTQLIPMAVVLLWLVVRFARAPSQWHLYVGFFMTVWMFHIHTVTTPLIAAWGIAMIVAGYPWLLQHWKRSLAAALAAVAAVTPYILSFVGQVQRQEEDLTASALVGFFQGFRGLIFFVSYGLDAHFLPDMGTSAYILPPGPLKALVLLGWISIPLFLLGAIVALRSLVAKRRTPPAEWDVQDHATLFCGCGILFTCLLYAATRLPAHPHYFNAAWVVFFYFLWVGVRQIATHIAGRALVTCYANSMAIVVVSMALNIHRNGGNQYPQFGPTLANQIAIAREMAPYRPERVDLQTKLYQLFPTTLGNLMDIIDKDEKPMEERPGAGFVVRYRGLPPDAHLTVDRLFVTPPLVPAPAPAPVPATPPAEASP